MKDSPDKSPALLQPLPKRDRSGRRLNKLPIFVTAGVVGVAAVAMIYTGYERNQHPAGAQAGENDTPGPADPSSILAGMPTGDIVPAVYKPVMKPAPKPEVPVQQPEVAATPPAEQTDDQAVQARKAAWQAYYAELAELQKDRLDAARSAMTSDTALSGSQGAPGAPVASAAPSGALPVSPALTASGGPAFAGYGGYGMGEGFPPPVSVDVQGQREKQAFLNQAGDLGADDDLRASIRNPVPFTIMATTAIPAVMIGGANSDQPGMVVGQVTRNVYDSATGKCLLIPAGSRLMGQYDNMVSAGQTRIGVIWTRLIFPDTSSIDLGAMEGADQGGYAGFHDQVDTHFWSKLGNAILISIAGAAAQLSQPTPAVSGTYSPQSIASAALGQQFSELGQEYARAGLSIPNTLEIRPGYRFVVMVNKDMHLRPYVDQRSATMPVSFGPVMQ